jgi:ubiquinone/menaquinone biosynthesis C-methylase UbiE
MAQSRPVKGWFDTPGRLGDRTLKQQLMGLDDLIARVPGKTVLDVGCAEGLISMQLFDEGAKAVHGLEVVAEHVKVADKIRGDRACTFEVADANTYVPVREYDIVIMLALLQKLRNPSAACARFAKAAREMVVLRLPPANAPTIIDARSGGHPHRIGDVITSNGFMLKNAQLGHLGEWIGYYERIKP